MKRILFIALMAVLTLPMVAQTNFRNITFDEAIEAAKAENKLVFVDFYTTWCMPCKRMATEVFPVPSVGEYMNANFISLKLDAEKEGKKLSDHYGVNAFPTFVVIDANRKEVVRSVGFKMGDEFVADLKRMLNPETSASKLEAAYNSGVRNARLIQDYTNSLMDGINDREQSAVVAQKAYDIVQDYFKNLSDQERLQEDNMFIYRNYSALLHSPSAKFMAQNVEKFPTSVRTEIREMVNQLYQDEVYSYFTAGVEMNEEKLATLKSEIKAANLDPKGEYELPYKFIDAYMKQPRADYLTFCQKNFKKLTTKQKSVLVNSFWRFFYKESSDLKVRAARFLREQLIDLDANTMYYAALQIGELEKQPTK